MGSRSPNGLRKLSPAQLRYAFALNPHFILERDVRCNLLRLVSSDDTNLLSRSRVLALIEAVTHLGGASDGIRPLILTGNEKFFSAGADLHEIRDLTGTEAYEFARMGQALMDTVENFPAPVYAAIHGHCMGGGLDLALACHHRIAAPGTVFGHRGAALGLMTGWGGTQRLPRLLGKAQALQMFVVAEKLTAEQALRIGLIEAIADDPIAEVVQRIGRGARNVGW
jgi:enoyl-CoA hydratase/carnithine racemase